LFYQHHQRKHLVVLGVGFGSLLTTVFGVGEFLVSGIGVIDEEMIDGLTDVVIGAEENDEGEF
jgi:hypothetical protein